MCDRMFTAVLAKKATKCSIMAVSRAASDERGSSTASGTQQQVSRCTLWRSRVDKGAFRVIITIFVLSYKVCVAVGFEASARLSSLLLFFVSSTFRSSYDRTRTFTLECAYEVQNNMRPHKNMSACNCIPMTYFQPMKRRF